MEFICNFHFKVYISRSCLHNLINIFLVTIKCVSNDTNYYYYIQCFVTISTYVCDHRGMVFKLHITFKTIGNSVSMSDA